MDPWLMRSSLYVHIGTKITSITGNKARKGTAGTFMLIQHTRHELTSHPRYSMKDANFVDQMRSSTLDLTQDEGSAVRVNKASQLKWDRKSKRFANTNTVGADNKKMIRSESGALLPASYRSGRYEEWRRSHKGIKSEATGAPSGTAIKHVS
jgi:ATP-dependent RNA helicase DDX54/DBP10